MKRLTSIIGLLLSLTVGQAVLAWWPLSPPVFPASGHMSPDVKEWQRVSLLEAVAHRIDQQVGGNFHLITAVKNSPVPNTWTISTNGPRGRYWAQITLSEVTTEFKWDGAYTWISGFGFDSHGGFTVQGFAEPPRRFCLTITRWNLASLVPQYPPPLDPDVTIIE